MGSLGNAVLKGLGALLVAMIALSVVGTVVATLMGIVMSVVSAIVTIAVVAIAALAAIGLFSLLRDDGQPDRAEVGWNQPYTAETGRTSGRDAAGVQADDGGLTDRIPGLGSDDGDAGTEKDPRERLREQYVAGDIDEREFERKMDRLLETERIEEEIDRSEGRDLLRDR